jgi:hypothetical protein
MIWARHRKHPASPGNDGSFLPSTLAAFEQFNALSMHNKKSYLACKLNEAEEMIDSEPDLQFQNVAPIL